MTAGEENITFLKKIKNSKFLTKTKQNSNQRWISAGDWDTELKCDGNEVAVGACSGGGAHGHKDCPGQGF